MHPQHFHDKIDKPRLIAALAGAERNTAGKVYVYVSHRLITDALGAARVRFHKLGLASRHEQRPSVLIYIAPKTNKFAIIGDEAVHERCGDAYWQELAARLSLDLRAGDPTAALVNAIATLGKTLEQHFPRPAR
jgi:uncharacterized membrane protein